MTVGAIDVPDRCPICLAKSSIDTPGGRSGFLLDIGVFRDLCPALRGDLEISHLSAPLDLLLEEPLECRKPLRDSFRVIQSIDPNNEGATVEASNNTLDEW